MTDTACAVCDLLDSRAAGHALAADLRAGLGGAVPDAVIVFASAQHDYERLLAALAERSGCERIAGASSAGEFSNGSMGTGRVSAMAIRSGAMRFRVGLGEAVATDARGAARRVAAAFSGLQRDGAASHHSALVMADALAGHTEAMIDELTLATGGNYSFFGGGAGDDGAFRKTHVFAGTKAYSDAVVALEILSERPIGIGAAHGWQDAGLPMRVTEADGMRLVSLNGAPAVDAFADHAAATGQRFDRGDPMPFFLHNVIGIRSRSQYRLRVPLGVHEDGSIACAAAVEGGSVVCLMRTSEASAIEAAQRATRAALAAMGGQRVGAALVFDCVATRLRMGRAFEQELRGCGRLLAPAPFVGCNTYGQIVRAEGQFGGFHNCTAVVCTLPA